MSTQSRRCFRLISCLTLFSGLALVTFGAQPSWAVSPPTQDQSTWKWIPGNGDGWLPTYENMVKLQPTQQRAIFTALSAKERSRLWVTHLERYLETHEELTAAQALLLDDAIELAGHPQLFAREATDRKQGTWDLFFKELLAHLRARAEDLFTRETLGEIFGHLGAQKATAPDCGCNTGSDFCGTSHMCSGGGCWGSGLGCGWLWLESCNGICARVLLPWPLEE